MSLRNLFNISKAKMYLLPFILITSIYIVYNYALKQSNNELEKFEERFIKDNKLISRNHIEAANSMNLINLSTKEKGMLLLF